MGRFWAQSSTVILAQVSQAEKRLRENKDYTRRKTWRRLLQLNWRISPSWLFPNIAGLRSQVLLRNRIWSFQRTRYVGSSQNRLARKILLHSLYVFKLGPVLAWKGPPQTAQMADAIMNVHEANRTGEGLCRGFWPFYIKTIHCGDLFLEFWQPICSTVVVFRPSLKTSLSDWLILLLFKDAFL